VQGQRDFIHLQMRAEKAKHLRLIGLRRKLVQIHMRRARHQP